MMLSAVGVDSAELHVALMSPSKEAMRAAVAAGAYVTVVSMLMVVADTKAGLLCQANLVLPSRPFYLIRQRSRYNRRASLALEDLIERADGTDAAGMILH